MKFIVCDDYAQMSAAAAELFAAQLKQKPNSVLGLATGSTPIGLYQHLVKLHKEGLDFSQAISFNLDEYVSLSPDHDQSYHYFMHQHLFNHINMKSISLPNGNAADMQAACTGYDAEIDNAGGIDMQLLGIGLNGHIGFNEPAEALSLNTHVVALTQSTIDANARFFATPDLVPKTAITMGLRPIMQAKKVVLVANSAAKAQIIKTLFDGKITTNIPATLLSMHPDVTVVLDKEAAGLL